MAQTVQQSVATSISLTTTIINPFTRIVPEEEDYYQSVFAFCDKDKSGHITATELKKALEYMNQNPLGVRAPRKVDYSYVNTLLTKGDTDASLTLDYPEFCRLLNLERAVFAELNFSKYVNDFLKLEEAIEVLKLAGFVYSADWEPFLKQYVGANGKISTQVITTQVITTRVTSTYWLHKKRMDTRIKEKVNLETPAAKTEIDEWIIMMNG